MVGEGREHRFGGPWTETKLEVLKNYLKAYTQALKKQSFRKDYIDAFAGTGYRTKTSDQPQGGRLPFREYDEDGPSELLDGSARIALKVTPSFDKHIFIEKNAERCAELEKLRHEFPEKAPDIHIIKGDANQAIQAMCSEDWSNRRAVLFLDPYGMQVEWATIESIAGTKAIDLWVLFPLGIGVNRLLTRSGEIPESWRSRLNTLLGTEDWYDEFYKKYTDPDLFGNEEERVEKVSLETIGRYFNDRLRQVFAGVAEPGVLKNKTNSQMYLFCFAVSNENEKAKSLALRIADNILGNLS
jgi:three-Cys-motif partner protein